MTIASLANFICGKLQKTDPESVAKCKMYLRNRWEIIWNSRLWRRAFVPEQMSVAAGEVQLTMPETIGSVIALRFGACLPLDVISWEEAFRNNPCFYEKTGLPCRFIQAGRDDTGRVLIRLTSAPTQTDTLLIIGKAPFPPCSNDTDAPSDYLDAVDAVLLAFGEGDMLERNERRQAAQLKFNEATGLIAVMESNQNDQQAQSYTIAPQPVQLNQTDW